MAKIASDCDLSLRSHVETNSKDLRCPIQCTTTFRSNDADPISNLFIFSFFAHSFVFRFISINYMLYILYIAYTFINPHSEFTFSYLSLQHDPFQAISPNHIFLKMHIICFLLTSVSTMKGLTYFFIIILCCFNISSYIRSQSKKQSKREYL